MSSVQRQSPGNAGGGEHGAGNPGETVQTCSDPADRICDITPFKLILAGMLADAGDEGILWLRYFDKALRRARVPSALQKLASSEFASKLLAIRKISKSLFLQSA